MASEQAQPGSDSSPEDSNVPAESPSTAPDAQSSQTEIDVTGTAQEAPTAAETASAETAPSTTAESEQDGVEQVEAGTETSQSEQAKPAQDEESQQEGERVETEGQAAEQADPAQTAFEALESAEHTQEQASTTILRTAPLGGSEQTQEAQSQQQPAQQEPPQQGKDEEAKDEQPTADPFAAFGAASATSLLFHAPAPEDVAAARERAEREREEARLREVQEEEQAEEAEYEDPEPGAGVTSRRRRRRRRGSEDLELIGGDDGDPEQTITRIRTARVVDGSAPTTVQSVKGSTRLEAKKQRRRESRQTGRRRQVITEAEFLARRESVERTMVVRQKNDRIQIGVLEDGILAEHFVSHTQQDSLIGSVYLGKVQNVLPSMEAAFVDIGRGRNAVLYAGEVDWDKASLNGAAKRIENALKPGDPVLVQATKDPVGHKGARLTSQISLPGRYLVFVPGGSMTGISRKLPDVERQRLKKILKDHLPEGAGVIVRTAAEGASEEELTNDINRLRTQWEQIQEKAAQGKTLAPELLYAEPDLTIKTVRDVFNEDFTAMHVQGQEAWDGIEAYVTYVAPDLLDRVHRWEGDEDLFAHYRVDDQIFKALERKVMLPSGGSLVIDRTEAMTVVDVNTGKFTGSGGNLEETVTKNNLEAAEEIVRQLRLRDIGGIVVIDFIDMVLEANRDLVLRRLVECLGRDRTKHQVAEVTSLGLVQMTRKRMGTGLLEVFSEDCETCDGRGVVVHDHPLKGRSSGSSDNRQGRNDRKRSRRLPGAQDEQRPRAEDPEQAKRAQATRSALAAIASASGHDTDSSASAGERTEAASASESAGDQESQGQRPQESQDSRESGKRRRKRRGKRSRGRGQDGQAPQDQDDQDRSDQAQSDRQDSPQADPGQGQDTGAQAEQGRGESDGRSGQRRQRGERSSGRGGRGRSEAQSGTRSEDETRSLIEARIRAASGEAPEASAPREDAADQSAPEKETDGEATPREASEPKRRDAAQGTQGRRERRSRTARAESQEAAQGASQGEQAAAAQEKRRSRTAAAAQAAPEPVQAPAAPTAPAAQGTATVRDADAEQAAPVRQRARRSRRAAAPAGTPEAPQSAPAASATVTAGSASVVSTSEGASQVTINGEVIELPQGQSAAEALGAGGSSGSQLESLASSLGEREPGAAGPRRRPRRSRRASAPEAAPQAGPAQDGGDASQGEHERS
ncbi:Rne/Rng family ribonuclease [Kocuria palustris]|uniref:Rne/Rng family ribonuclease n=1 Tax=Kocuria palustris TaxID=71999 RepID=UPI00344DA172